MRDSKNQFEECQRNLVQSQAEIQNLQQLLQHQVAQYSHVNEGKGNLESDLLNAQTSISQLRAELDSKKDSIGRKDEEHTLLQAKCEGLKTENIQVTTLIKDIKTDFEVNKIK